MKLEETFLCVFYVARRRRVFFLFVFFFFGGGGEGGLLTDVVTGQAWCRHARRVVRCAALRCVALTTALHPLRPLCAPRLTPQFIVK